jgi:hypothetical protein
MKRWSASVLALIMSVGIRASSRDRIPDNYHGERTPLQAALAGIVRKVCDRIATAEVWTFKDLAVAVDLEPPGVKGRPAAWWSLTTGPWCYADATQAEHIKEVIRKSRITLIIREGGDPRLCIVNELTGARSLTESPREQDVSAVELPCEDVLKSFETLAELPEGARADILKLLRSR